MSAGNYGIIVGVSTFEILLMCLPCFVLVGGGVYYVLAALFPFWRSPAWNHWKTYNYGCDSETYVGNRSPNSLLVALGFMKAPKPIAEGDYSPRTALVIGVVSILLGAAGIIWIVHTSLNS